MRTLLLLLLGGYFLPGIGNPDDATRQAYIHKLKTVPQGSLSQLTLRMAETFMNTPYVAHTLEGNSTEQLVCRFDALDCTTLVDLSVALAVARQKELSYEEFESTMTRLRYVNGTIDGYASRQHYFLSWKSDNQKNGLLQDITQQLGGIPYSKNIHFMSTHASLYQGISSDEVLNQIRASESRINQETHYYIPKTKVAIIEAQLRDGDIIGITSTVEGLDCNHQGIIKIKNKRAYLLHASTTSHKVILSEVPLADYLNSIKRHSGIIVLRLKDTY